MTNLIQCPDCRGSGNHTGFVCSPTSGSFRTMPCFRCKGHRRNLGQMALWLRMGEAIRTDRIRENCGGRERARMLGLTPLQLNDVEHGKVDPMEVLYHAANIQLTKRAVKRPPAQSQGAGQSAAQRADRRTAQVRHAALPQPGLGVFGWQVLDVRRAAA